MTGGQGSGWFGIACGEAALSMLISLYVKLHSPREREREGGNRLCKSLSKKKTPPLGRGSIEKATCFLLSSLALGSNFIELLPILHCYFWLLLVIYSQNAKTYIYIYCSGTN